MRFEWHEDKNRDNIRKHGLDFADIEPLFSSPRLTGSDNRRDYAEDRWISIGFLEHRILCVVYTLESTEIVRLISARKATRHECEQFQKFLRNRLGSD